MLRDERYRVLEIRNRVNVTHVSIFFVIFNRTVTKMQMGCFACTATVSRDSNPCTSFHLLTFLDFNLRKMQIDAFKIVYMNNAHIFAIEFIFCCFRDFSI